MRHADLQALQKTKPNGPLAEMALLDVPFTLEEDDPEAETAPPAQVNPDPGQYGETPISTQILCIERTHWKAGACALLYSLFSPLR